MAEKGLLITFEGIDGSGKSTQMDLCAKALSSCGHPPMLTCNPGGTDFGKSLRQILLHSITPVYPMSELLLFIADRAQHTEEVVIPALREKRIILCDRHLDSTIAYQGYGRKLDIQTIQSLNQIALQGIKPDLTFLFDGEPVLLSERVQKRGVADRMEGEKLDFHQRVREGFLALASEEPNRIVVLNALQNPDILHQQVMQHLSALLPVSRT